MSVVLQIEIPGQLQPPRPHRRRHPARGRNPRPHRPQRRRQQHPAQDPLAHHRPTSGQVKIKGRGGSLLEVGTGFHPELTGHENLYLNGAILGMKKAEIDRKLAGIIDPTYVDWINREALLI